MTTPHDASDYQAQLLALLPPGKAFPRDPASETGLLVLALADEFARLETAALLLIEEADPRTTIQLIGDWEQEAGLPDPVIPAPVDLPGRRAAVQARLVGLPSITAADFIGLAATQGYVATIAYHTPFAADVSHADDLLYDAASVFWWVMTVHVAAGTVTPLVALERLVRLQAPDHTYPTFVYVSP